MKHATAIDFHTHVFPDAIADRSVAFLAQKGGVAPYLRGTAQDLLASMAANAIDLCVVLPVATSPRQVPTINRTSFALNEKNGLVYFGAIHPDTECPEQVLDEVVAHGLAGIKIHPDYQGARFDDPRYVRILRAAAERDLIVVTHAGVDVGYPDDVHCTPDMVLRVLGQLDDLSWDKLVLAHLGGCDLPQEVLQKLVGKRVYFDTAFVLDRYPTLAKQLIEAHGADRVVFGTDSPWADQGTMVKALHSLGLDPGQEEAILFGNARKLLGL